MQNLIEKVKPFVEKQYELIHSVEVLVQESTAQACDSLRIEEGEFDAQDATHCQALTRAVSAALDEKFREHPLYASLKSNLVPYDERKYQYLELQHRLTQELKQYWAPDQEAMDQEADEAEESAALDGDTQTSDDSGTDDATPIEEEKSEKEDPLTGDISPSEPAEETE